VVSLELCAHPPLQTHPLGSSQLDMLNIQHPRRRLRPPTCSKVRPMNEQALACQHYALLFIAMFVKTTIILASLTLSLNCLVPKTMTAGRAEFIAFCTILASLLINFYGLAYGPLFLTVSSPSFILIWYFCSLLLSVGRIQFHSPSSL
jgi:hypothetical protein